MSDLDNDVQALTGNVAGLTTAVNVAIDALKGIVDTSADDAAVKAANDALVALTAALTAAVPTPPAG